MPLGDGKLFLPVRAEIRKKIKKQEGDYVHVVLFPDKEPLEIPEEMLLCLHDEPAALAFFNSLPEGEKQNYIKWIHSTRSEETKINRMAHSINKLMNRKRFGDK